MVAKKSNKWLHFLSMCLLLQFVSALNLKTASLSSHPHVSKKKKRHKLHLPNLICQHRNHFFFFFPLFYSRYLVLLLGSQMGENNNQPLIYLCGQNDLMLFLVVDRMIWVELHSIDKTVMKCYSLDE